MEDESSDINILQLETDHYQTPADATGSDFLFATLCEDAWP